MNTGGLEPIVTRCKMMQLAKNSFSWPVILCRNVPTDTVEEQILDFLEGRTNGGDLLHALHDHVLNEPIPERMRALFGTGSAD